MTQTRHELIHLLGFGNRKRLQSEATIALCGPQHCGKSTFLASLEFAAWHEGIGIYAADIQTERRMEIERECREKHHFPAANTMAYVEPAPLSFKVTPAKGKQEVMLKIVELSGQWWKVVERESHIQSRSVSSPELILSQCDGLICLMDPTQALTRAHSPDLWMNLTAKADPAVELQSMLAHLRRLTMSGDKVRDVRIALCLTKMDRPEHYTHLGKEDEYFKRLYGPLPLDHWMNRKRLKFFGCSSVGVVRRESYLLSNTHHNQDGAEVITDPRIPPLHLLRPIQWILSAV